MDDSYLERVRKYAQDYAFMEWERNEYKLRVELYEAALAAIAGDDSLYAYARDIGIKDPLKMSADTVMREIAKRALGGER